VVQPHFLRAGKGYYDRSSAVQNERDEAGGRVEKSPGMPKFWLEKKNERQISGVPFVA
jgi:hypothetical protein